MTRSTKTLIVFPSCSVTKFATLYKNEITEMANIYYGYSTIANDFHITWNQYNGCKSAS